MKTILSGIAILALSAFTLHQSVLWNISTDHAIKFSGTEAEGVFKTFSGDIVFDEENLASSYCMLSIEVTSINTGNGMKNKHAVSDKWFDAEKYPYIEFQSSQFSKTESGFLATGKLKMHGIENEVVIPFTFENNVFASRFSVNRLDYHVGTMKGSSKKVSNEIKLDLSIPVTRK